MQNDQLQKPLYLATCGARDSMISLSLMNKQLDVSIHNRIVKALLYLATRVGELEIIRRLLFAGLLATVIDDQGCYPLQFCLSSEKFSASFFELLLQHHDIIRADPCLETDNNSRNLLHHYVQSVKCSENIIGRLLDHDTDKNGIDTNGRFPA